MQELTQCLHQIQMAPRLIIQGYEVLLLVHLNFINSRMQLEDLSLSTLTMIVI